MFDSKIVYMSTPLTFRVILLIFNFIYIQTNLLWSRFRGLYDVIIPYDKYVISMRNIF